MSLQHTRQSVKTWLTTPLADPTGEKQLVPSAGFTSAGLLFIYLTSACLLWWVTGCFQVTHSNLSLTPLCMKVGFFFCKVSNLQVSLYITFTLHAYIHTFLSRGGGVGGGVTGKKAAKSETALQGVTGLDVFKATSCVCGNKKGILGQTIMFLQVLLVPKPSGRQAQTIEPQ